MTRLSGYIALILFIMSFYLANRSLILNQIFNGLQRQLRFHHWIALISVSGMLIHLCQLLWNNREHVELLFDWGNLALLSGWVTFIGIILVTPLAFYRAQINYRKWRIIHNVTAVCLITALFHTLLLYEPDRSAEQIVFLLLTTFGLTGLLLSVILPRLSFWGKRYFVTSVFEIRPKLFILQLQPTPQASEHFHFNPGHFIYLKFVSHGFSRIWHPFTIISKPSENYIELLIKARGKDTERLNILSLPAPVRILAPFGMTFWKANQSQLWIAYGVGAAIFLAAIRSFPSSFSKKIHFICCDNSLENIFYSKELDDCEKHYRNFTWEYYIGSGQQFIAEFKHRPFDSKFFEKVRICGHPGFQRSLKSLLIFRGIRKQNIQLEGLL